MNQEAQAFWDRALSALDNARDDMPKYLLCRLHFLK